MEIQVVSPALEMHIVMDFEGTTKKIPPMQTPRARLLLSCGEYILAMARRAYQRVETMRCPVGCVARGVSRAAAEVPLGARLRLQAAPRRPGRRHGALPGHRARRRQGQRPRPPRRVLARQARRPDRRTRGPRRRRRQGRRCGAVRSPQAAPPLPSR